MKDRYTGTRSKSWSGKRSQRINSHCHERSFTTTLLSTISCATGDCCDGLCIIRKVFTLAVVVVTVEVVTFLGRGQTPPLPDTKGVKPPHSGVPEP